MRPSSSGGWTTYLDLADDLREPELLTRLAARTGAPTARATLAEGVTIEKRGQQGTKTPVITREKCCTTDRSDSYRPGHIIQLRGRNLKLDDDDPEQGVFLTPVGTTDTRRCAGSRGATKGRVLATVARGLHRPPCGWKCASASRPASAPTSLGSTSPPYAKTSFTTRAGSTPLSRWSRPCTFWRAGQDACQ
ncbi:MAG: DUF4469 domain-containing protein [Chthoniobacteraceae bacterium]